jgi:hypothetical protein
LALQRLTLVPCRAVDQSWRFSALLWSHAELSTRVGASAPYSGPMQSCPTPRRHFVYLTTLKKKFNLDRCCRRDVITSAARWHPSQPPLAAPQTHPALHASGPFWSQVAAGVVILAGWSGKFLTPLRARRNAVHRKARPGHRRSHGLYLLNRIPNLSRPNDDHIRAPNLSTVFAKHIGIWGFLRRLSRLTRGRQAVAAAFLGLPPSRYTGGS